MHLAVHVLAWSGCCWFALSASWVGFDSIATTLVTQVKWLCKDCHCWLFTCKWQQLHMNARLQYQDLPWSSKFQSCKELGGRAMCLEASQWRRFLPWTCCPALLPSVPGREHQTFTNTNRGKVKSHSLVRKKLFLKSKSTSTGRCHYWLILKFLNK